MVTTLLSVDQAFDVFFDTFRDNFCYYLSDGMEHANIHPIRPLKRSGFFEIIPFLNSLGKISDWIIFQSAEIQIWMNLHGIWIYLLNIGNDRTLSKEEFESNRGRIPRCIIGLVSSSNETPSTSGLHILFAASLIEWMIAEADRRKGKWNDRRFR